MRKKAPKRRRSAKRRDNRPLASHCNECWSMDFMSDQLFSGQRFRILTLVDNFSRESLATRAGQRLTGDDVVTVLDEVAKRRGRPKTICVAAHTAALATKHRAILPRLRLDKRGVAPIRLCQSHRSQGRAKTDAMSEGVKKPAGRAQV